MRESEQEREMKRFVDQATLPDTLITMTAAEMNSEMLLSLFSHWIVALTIFSRQLKNILMFKGTAHPELNILSYWEYIFPHNYSHVV